MEHVAPVHADSPYRLSFPQPAKMSTPLMSFRNLDLGYGGDAVLSGLSHTILPGARIGVMGQNASKPAKGAMLTVQEAQLAMEKLPQFKGNVKAVRTDVLVDKAAEELYPHWRQRFEEWEKTGSDFGYHYMGSAIWFNRIGRAMGEAMLKLKEDKG